MHPHPKLFFQHKNYSSTVSTWLNASLTNCHFQKQKKAWSAMLAQFVLTTERGNCCVFIRLSGNSNVDMSSTVFAHAWSAQNRQGVFIIVGADIFPFTREKWNNSIL